MQKVSRNRLEVAIVLGIIAFALFSLAFFYSEKYQIEQPKVIKDRAYLASTIGCLPTELTKAEFDAQQRMYLEIFHSAVRRCP